MTGFILTAESVDLARIFVNALAFFPAKSAVQTARLDVEVRGTSATLTMTGTDTYTIGRDWCEARDVRHDYPDENFSLFIEVDHEGLRELDAQTRKDSANNQQSTGTLEYRSGDCLIFRPGGPKADTGVAQDCTGNAVKMIDKSTGNSFDFWDAIEDVLTLLDAGEEIYPDRITLDPGLIGRFNKVRLPADCELDKVMDIIYQGEGRGLNIRIGPTFKGALMPINREKYVDKQGDAAQDALW